MGDCVDNKSGCSVTVRMARLVWNMGLQVCQNTVVGTHARVPPPPPLACRECSGPFERHE